LRERVEHERRLGPFRLRDESLAGLLRLREEVDGERDDCEHADQIRPARTDAL
jgi:hypothetical protein